MYRPQFFHFVNESVWTNFPYDGDGTNIPPTDCTDGYALPRCTTCSWSRADRIERRDMLRAHSGHVPFPFAGVVRHPIWGEKHMKGIPQVLRQEDLLVHHHVHCRRDSELRPAAPDAGGPRRGNHEPPGAGRHRRQRRSGDLSALRAEEFGTKPLDDRCSSSSLSATLFGATSAPRSASTRAPFPASSAARCRGRWRCSCRRSSSAGCWATCWAPSPPTSARALTRSSCP